MSDYTNEVKKRLSEGGCWFHRQGKGDHEIWKSPHTPKPFTVDGSIKSRALANKVLLKDAGLEKKVKI